MSIELLITVVGIFVFFILGTAIAFSQWYKKTSQGQALVRTGKGGVQVSFNGMLVIPVLHRLEVMDISLKSFTIERTGKEGLICKDNMRADIKVTFFISVNGKEEDVKYVAQNIGTARASDLELLTQLFDAKFSEALKTVGKRFDFTELYSERDQFKKEMLDIIGTDLNGYSLDSAAIDYLEQTSLDCLDPSNILDSEGIKKITELTADQNMKTNQIKRDEEKVITQQNVEAKETILDQERRLAEKEENQKMKIASIKARTKADTEKIEQEEKLKSEQARIQTEEEIEKAEELRQQEVIILRKAKEGMEAKKTEEVEQERMLAQTERERLVEVAQIAKTKEVEQERRDIQQTIKERIELEKATVEKEEEIKDTRAFAEAERVKAVAIKAAEQRAEESLVEQIKAAEAHKEAEELRAMTARKTAEIKAEQDRIEASTSLEVAGKNAESKKILADATAAEAAALGLSEAQVMEAKAEALEKQGESEANVIQSKAEAEAAGIKMTKAAENEAYRERGNIDAKILEEKGLAEAKVIETQADSIKKQGLAEAEVMAKKAESEAFKISARAEAMQKLDGVGREHEEFKLRLEHQRELEMARINIQKDVVESQAKAMAEALKSSKINIVGGETMFYESIMKAITRGQSFDSLINHSQTLTGVKNNLLGEGGEGENLIGQVKGLITELGISSDDVKNLSVSALLMQLIDKNKDEKASGLLQGLLEKVRQAGLGDEKAGKWL